VRAARLIAACRDERWDGTGLPQRLCRDAIPIEARIAAVATAFVSLLSGRVYGQGLDAEEARRRVRAGCGTQFDPACVDAFERCWPAIASMPTEAGDRARVA
jgi:putative two-component system response regulator